jgi:hypothetical protein
MTDSTNSIRDERHHTPRAVAETPTPDEEAFAAQLLERIMRDVPSDDDIAAVQRQLGRYPRGMVAVGRRCDVCGTPLVTVTRPLVDGKVPFPTTFYLCGTAAVRAASRLEAQGVMAQYSQLVHDDAKVSAAYHRAHRLYLAFRHALAVRLGDTEEHIESVSAGGLPTRVKCLHALIGQSLVMGPDANPIGDMALERMKDEFSPSVCRCHADSADNADNADNASSVVKANSTGEEQ